MKRVVFYSWQSDLPNATNRGFIQQALESAAQKIATDASIAVEPVIDRDTQGISGSPDISATIFAKIATSDVFVADVSIAVRPPTGRVTPNPNVLIELGYALRARGHEKVLLVFNEAYGKLDELPFDLKMRRILTYNEPASNADRATGRKALAAVLEAALRGAVTTPSATAEPNAIEPALKAIENAEPGRPVQLRKALASIIAQLDAVQPKRAREGGTEDDLMKAIDNSQEAIADAARIAEVIAIVGDQGAATDMYRWFGNVLERYDLPREFQGSYNTGDFDFFKFIGYAMFTNFIAVLLRERKWTILEHVLSEPLPIKFIRGQDGPGSILWQRLSAYAPGLMGYGRSKGRMSLPGDLVKSHHTTGAVATVVSFEDFIEADYFLFVRSCADDAGWTPWSYPFLEHVPAFIRAAERKNTAEQLAKAVNANGIPELRKQIVGGWSHLREVFSSGFLRTLMRESDIDRIGTVG